MALLEAGHDVVVVDNLDNSSARAIDGIEAITGRRPAFVVADVQDVVALHRVFVDHPIDGVIHFAGLKAVGESVEDPVRYYRVNLGTTLALLEAMGERGVFDIVFSSSATVYAPELEPPFVEVQQPDPSTPTAGPSA